MGIFPGHCNILCIFTCIFILTIHTRQYRLAADPKWLRISDALGLSCILSSIGATTSTCWCMCASYVVIPTVSSCTRSGITGSIISKTSTLFEQVIRWILYICVFSALGNPICNDNHYYMYLLSRAYRPISPCCYLQHYCTLTCEKNTPVVEFVPFFWSVATGIIRVQYEWYYDNGFAFGYWLEMMHTIEILVFLPMKSTVFTV